MFIERMTSVTNRGKLVAMDTTVQSLFQSLSAMHPHIMHLIEESKVAYKIMQENLGVIHEALEGLNDMRANTRRR